MKFQVLPNEIFGGGVHGNGKENKQTTIPNGNGNERSSLVKNTSSQFIFRLI